MTEQKWVDFNYQRYLDGDEVFTIDGHLVKQLTRFEDLPDQPLGGECFCMVGLVGARIIHSDAKGIYQSKQFLFMKPKTKKLFIGVRTQTFFNERGHYCTNAFSKKEDLESYIGEVDDQYQIIEIEIEV